MSLFRWIGHCGSLFPSISEAIRSFCMCLAKLYFYSAGERTELKRLKPSLVALSSWEGSRKRKIRNSRSLSPTYQIWRQCDLREILVQRKRERCLLHPRHLRLRQEKCEFEISLSYILTSNVFQDEIHIEMVSLKIDRLLFLCSWYAVAMISVFWYVPF